MSYSYKCEDCGFVWRDVELKGYFLRCLRCDSQNVRLQKPRKRIKHASFIISIILWGLLLAMFILFITLLVIIITLSG
ncbi:MAG: hypothetical protein ACFFDB_02020 [Promethearchaeota archaeon]